MNPDWQAIGIVVLIIAITGLTFMEVTQNLDEELAEECEDRGADLLMPNESGTEVPQCEYPNGTQEPVLVEGYA